MPSRCLFPYESCLTRLPRCSSSPSASMAFSTRAFRSDFHAMGFHAAAGDFNLEAHDDPVDW